MEREGFANRSSHACDYFKNLSDIAQNDMFIWLEDAFETIRNNAEDYMHDEGIDAALYDECEDAFVRRRDMGLLRDFINEQMKTIVADAVLRAAAYRDCPINPKDLKPDTVRALTVS